MDTGDVADEARRLRVEEELTIAQIRARLNASRDDVQRWLAGVPAPEWTKRPRAKDALRAQAVELHRCGLSVPGIARKLGVARSTAYEWTRHIELVQDTAEAVRRKEHAKVRGAVERIGPLSHRDVLLLGAAIYWCEGSKAKPWRSSETIQFVNSDVRLIKLFLRFLAAAGHAPDDIAFRLAIHETADHEAAQRWWADQLGVAPATFLKTSLKSHVPASANRRDQGDDHHGCLSVEVRQSRETYWLIDGIMSALCGPEDVADEDAR